MRSQFRAYHRLQHLEVRLHLGTLHGNKSPATQIDSLPDATTPQLNEETTKFYTRTSVQPSLLVQACLEKKIVSEMGVAHLVWQAMGGWLAHLGLSVHPLRSVLASISHMLSGYCIRL
jgi:hypothetical protein